MPEDTCDLCGLPLRYNTVRHDIAGRAYRFCCMGCRQVFVILLEAAGSPDPLTFQQTALFRQCREMGIIPSDLDDLSRRAAKESGGADPPDAAAVSRENGRLLDADLDVGDMWCPACAWVIEQALVKQPGIVAAACNFSTDRVRCTYDPLHASPDRIIATLSNLGYSASPPGREAADAGKKRELTRLCISAVLTMNVMMLSFALYSGFFSRLDTEAIGKISWPIFIMASVVFFYGGRLIHKKAWAGVVSAAPGMETLISIGATTAYAYSVFNFFRGSLHLYFDTASMLMTLVLVGKMLERKAKDRIRDDLDNFFSLRPTKARICTDQSPQGRYVSADQLTNGDVFSVREGEIVPADGVILSGSSRVDESSLTGEARPVVKKAPQRIRSGARILSGSMRARADAVGAASLLGQMMAIMERALGAKTPIEGKTDRLLKVFVPAILLLAAATGGACLLRGLPFEAALIRTVTVLVIACPCSLGIAIPMARVAGISVAGKKGVVVRDFSAFEQAGQVRAFVFDKTGTVTEGSWDLLRIRLSGALSEKQVLALAAGLETESDHPLSGLILREAQKRRVVPMDLSHRKIYSNGISALSGSRMVKIGAEAFVAQGLKADGRLVEASASATGNQNTSRVYLSVDSRICAVFEFGDTIRAGTTAAVRELETRGYRIALVSGDGDTVTRAVGTRIGISDARGEMLPGDKAAFVSDWQAKGIRVAMVGDGVNDAPALVQSDLGIAVHSGSHLGKEAADITLMRGDPRQIPEFLDLAKMVNHKIHQNLWCAFIYNIVGIPVAMSGLLSPLVAVCAMLLSSLTVIGNTLHLSRYPTTFSETTERAL